MGDRVSWIAHAFKLFDALINPRRTPEPDQSVVTVAGKGVAPEAPSGDSTASILRLEPVSEADALAPHDECEIEAPRPNRSKAHPLNGMMKVGASS